MQQQLCPLVEQGAHQQQNTYSDIVGRFSEVYNSLPADPPELITPFWKEQLKELQNDWLPEPRYEFLRHKVISWTMFVPYSKFTPTELLEIGNVFSEEEQRMLLPESDVGFPRTVKILDDIYSSGNIIHHLYHIARYAVVTGQPVAASSIFEWGAGYGNMAKLYKRMWAFCTYTMVDTRMFSAIQWLYLSCIYGENEVVLHTTQQPIVPKKINIVPLALARGLDCDADMFVSTWAISESPKECQSLLVDRGLYGAGRVLMGHQGTSSAFPFADDVVRMVNGDCIGEDIPFLPGNRYLFK